jgi:exodeoxyribonuclease V alpha subunit
VSVDVLEPHDARRASAATGLLRTFNQAGVLAAADVHVALRLARLLGEDDETVLLATALAVRAPRLSSVLVDLAAVRETATSDVDVPVDVQALPWPELDPWIAQVAASALVAGEAAPLRLVGSSLYLDRYHEEERFVAAELAARSRDTVPGVDETVLRQGLDRLFSEPAPDLQRIAAAAAVLQRLCLVAGGPGTGKTTTVARILLLLDEQAAAAGAPPPLVALAAPTGKAAARLQEALHEQAVELGLPAAGRERLLELRASTLHRLLGTRPDTGVRFRHGRENQLAHDVVVVDETSMVSLSLMARLLEAVREGSRLVLVGDPEQLASVEAGAVLGDVVGPAADGLRMDPAARERLHRVTGHQAPAEDPPPGVTIGDAIVVLRQGYRFGGLIAKLAESIRTGDAETAIMLLRGGGEDLRWIEADPAERDALAPVRELAVAAGARIAEAARAGDGTAAIEALDDFRILCAHRRGPYGVSAWNAAVEGWLGTGASRAAWPVGRPLLVLENDYGLRLYNGDTGVVVARPDGSGAAVFERQGELVAVSPARLSAVDTAYAMTVHRSQGSQLDAVAVLLPPATSPILTRELLYTAVTRARRSVIVCGPEDVIRAALARRAARASGLTGLLWR